MKKAFRKLVDFSHNNDEDTPISLYDKVNPSAVIAHAYVRSYVEKQRKTNKSFDVPVDLWDIISKYYECEQILITTNAIGGNGGGRFSYRNNDNYGISSISWGTHNRFAIASLYFECVRFNNDIIQINDSKGRPFDNNVIIYKKETTKLCENNEIEWCIGANVYYGSTHDGIRCIEFITNKNNKKLIGLTENELKKYKRQLKHKKIEMPNQWFKMVGIEGHSGWLIDNIAFVFVGPKFLAKRWKI